MMRSFEVQRGAARRREAGFSLLELMIALVVTMVVAGLAVTLLTASFNIRAREDRKSDAIADVRRSLNTMTREIANAGYGLSGAYPANGIVAADSGTNSIRVLSNADRFTGGATPDSPASPDEDVIYQMVNDAANNQRYVVRYDLNDAVGSGTTILANRIDSFTIRYYPQKVVYTPSVVTVAGVPTCDVTNVTNGAGTAVSEVAPALASYIVLSICVQLPQVGTPGAAGYQPAAVQQLTSDVQLRNATITSF
jgi:type II secretory pathway pseudopilin PulG